MKNLNQVVRVGFLALSALLVSGASFARNANFGPLPPPPVEDVVGLQFGPLPPPPVEDVVQ